MSHYDVDYSGMSEADKVKKALADVAEWFGVVRFNKICLVMAKEKAPSRVSFAYQVSIGGVQGFPVHAWYEHMWQPTQHDMHVFAYYMR